ncbi:Uncharacterised protein [Mycobacteroides abscessus subsp. abscessus]|nr:Uncharacterised protein [Mycobacteroides abscessus subsp. abscessus]
MSPFLQLLERTFTGNERADHGQDHAPKELFNELFTELNELLRRERPCQLIGLLLMDWGRRDRLRPFGNPRCHSGRTSAQNCELDAEVV